MLTGMLGFSDSDITAWATVILAGVGLVSILTGIALSIATWRAATAARKATELQAREIAVLERQTELQEKQQEEARTSAFPWLRALLTGVGDQFADGTVAYVAGSAPAWSAEVWVRTSRGYYFGHVGFVAAGADREFRAILQTEDQSSYCPFQDFQKLVGDEISWIGVTWYGPGYWRGRHGWRQLQEGGRYVDELMGRSFDEEAAINDQMMEEAEDRARRAFRLRTTAVRPTYLSRLFRRRSPQQDA